MGSDVNQGFEMRCGWCGTVIRYVSYPFSTGMCNPCFIIETSRLRLNLLAGEVEFLETLLPQTKGV